MLALVSIALMLEQFRSDQLRAVNAVATVLLFAAILACRDAVADAAIAVHLAARLCSVRTHDLVRTLQVVTLLAWMVSAAAAADVTVFGVTVCVVATVATTVELYCAMEIHD
jgi:hypothetical protein